MGQRQVNVRLDKADVEVLEAAGFVNGLSLTDEARAGLLSHVAKVRADPLVEQALGIRAERSREKAKDEKEVVSSLDAKRKQARSKNA